MPIWNGHVFTAAASGHMVFKTELPIKARGRLFVCGEKRGTNNLRLNPKLTYGGSSLLI